MSVSTEVSVPMEKAYVPMKKASVPMEKVSVPTENTHFCKEKACLYMQK